MSSIIRKLILQQKRLLTTPATRLVKYSASGIVPAISRRTFITSVPRLDRVSDAEQQITIGSEYLNKGSLDMAMNSYHKSVQLAPSGTGYFNIGVCYFQMGKHYDAIKSFERSLEYTPSSSDAHTNIATCYLMLRDTENAIKHLEQASNFNPLDGEIQYNLACVYEAVGRLKDAKSRFERAEMLGIEKAAQSLEKLEKKM